MTVKWHGRFFSLLVFFSSGHAISCGTERFFFFSFLILAKRESLISRKTIESMSLKVHRRGTVFEGKRCNIIPPHTHIAIKHNVGLSFFFLVEYRSVVRSVGSFVCLYRDCAASFLTDRCAVPFFSSNTVHTYTRTHTYCTLNRTELKAVTFIQFQNLMIC